MICNADYRRCKVFCEGRAGKPTTETQRHGEKTGRKSKTLKHRGTEEAEVTGKDKPVYHGFTRMSADKRKTRAGPQIGADQKFFRMGPSGGFSSRSFVFCPLFDASSVVKCISDGIATTKRRSHGSSDIASAGRGDFCSRRGPLLSAWKFLAGPGRILPGCDPGVAAGAADLRLHAASRKDRGGDGADFRRTVSGGQPGVLRGDGIGPGGDGGGAGKKLRSVDRVI